jgi:type VI protein secretion system component Hcp
VKSPPPLVFVTREPDKLSQLLMQACITGEHFKKIVLATSKETLTMTDAVITSVQPTNHGGDRLDEIEHFAAQKVTMEFAAGASHTLPAIQYSSSAKTKLKFPR